MSYIYDNPDNCFKPNQENLFNLVEIIHMYLDSELKSYSRVFVDGVNKKGYLDEELMEKGLEAFLCVLLDKEKIILKNKNE